MAFAAYIPSFCECGRPTEKPGQRTNLAPAVSSRCARCADMESRGLNSPPETCGVPTPGIHDHDDLGIISLTRIAKACDAFFARRGLPKPAWNAIRQSNAKTAS